MNKSQSLDDPRTDPFDVAQDAAVLLAGETGVAQHDFALVLGSGWGGAAELIGETIAELPSWEVPGFAEPAVAGHVGTIRSIRMPETGKHVLVLGARDHLYEGRGVRHVAHGVRTAAKAGASVIVLTNGCGGLDVLRGPGTPVLISDHLNLTGASPLEGAAFVDLTDVYSPRLRAIAHQVDPALTEGVYAQFRGPQYETPAEVRMAGRLGADLVGMSTALEAIAARHAGLEVLGISLVTNLAAGIGTRPLAHEDVLEAGVSAGPRISRLLAQIVRQF